MLFVTLYALKALDAMVESGVCWVKIKVLELCNLWPLPSTVGTVVVAHQHVIGEKGTKGILMVGSWLGLLRDVFFNNKVLGVKSILS